MQEVLGPPERCEAVVTGPFQKTRMRGVRQKVPQGRRIDAAPAGNARAAPVHVQRMQQRI